MFLLDFIKSLIPALSKSEVLEDVRVTESELETTVIPAANQAAENIKVIKLNSQDNKNLINVFFRNYSLSSSSKNILEEIANKLPVVLQNLKESESLFDKEAGKDIIASGVTNRKAILLRAIEQISFISRFTLDLISVLYYNECKNNESVENTDEISLPKVTIDRVTKNLAVYATLLSVYGDKKFTIEKRLTDLPDVVLNDSTASAVLSVYGDNKLDPIGTPLVLGFENNPIYHVRLVIAEWQANRYKSMRDKKKMLELRLMHLKLLDDKKSDPKLEKEISYIQSRIDSIEYSMAKMEKDVS